MRFDIDLKGLTFNKRIVIIDCLIGRDKTYEQ
jgi:hypothetical protein